MFCVGEEIGGDGGEIERLILVFVIASESEERVIQRSVFCDEGSPAKDSATSWRSFGKKQPQDDTFFALARNDKVWKDKCIYQKKIVGFSLIELLIVVAIISILSALCIPLYSQHFVREKRLEAEITLSKLALAMENYYIAHNSYEDASLESLGFGEKIAGDRYQLEIVKASPNEFELAATPLNKQAEKDDRCGTLLLNSTGEKSISGSGPVVDCWQSS